MKKFKEKFANIPHHKRGHIIQGAILFICIISLCLSFVPDFSPLFHHNTVSVIKNIQHNLHNTTPVKTFAKIAKQNDTEVLDKAIPSSGCGLPQTFTSDTTTYVQINSDGSQRRFLVYLPKGYENKSPHTLILAFHGYASGAFAIEQFTKFDKLADINNIIMVYPEGTTSLVGLRGWDTGLHPTIKAHDVLFVSNMLNNLQSNLCINRHRIYATGFSNGGGFVAELACQFSNRIAAFSPISGSYVTAFKTCRALRPLPIMEFHGTKDTIVPYLGMEAKKEYAALTWARDWAKRNKCKTKPTTTNETKKITQYIWTDCKDNATVIHYRIKGEGHSWPHSLFPETINNTTQKVPVTNIIWDFFKNHPLPATVEQTPATSST
jgi:polyhydroxybutyrate depolymerase